MPRQASTPCRAGARAFRNRGPRAAHAPKLGRSVHVRARLRGAAPRLRPRAGHRYDPTMTTRVTVVRTGAVDVPLPRYQTTGAAGLDLCAAVEQPVCLRPGERQLIPTGLRFAIPTGFEAQVRPRSGLALRHGVTVLNAPGTIDSDFRGQVGVVLINHGDQPFHVHPLARIAQLVLSPVARANLELELELDATERGSGGYGSTGT